jgi:enoyl-CoA hydratase
MNALNMNVLKLLKEKIAEIAAVLHADDSEEEGNSPRVLVIRGSGDRAFVAGADINEFQADGGRDVAELVTLGQTVMNELERLPIPSIAVLDGFALGGGLELALACDLIVADSRAMMGFPEVKLGILPGFGGTQRLPLRVGVGTARYLIYTGDMIRAERAHELGLVDIYCTPQTLAEQLGQLINTLSSRAPLAVSAAKRVVREGLRAGMAAGLGAEKESFLSLLATEDATEGINAFLKKRVPNFTGK